MSIWWINESGLDPDQREVVKLSKTGRFLVSGPPGSGKTNLLLLRANFLHKLKMHDFAILSLTHGLKTFIASGVRRYGVVPPDRVDTTMGWMMKQLNAIGGNLDDLPEGFVERRGELAVRLSAQIDRRGLSHIHSTLLLDEAQDYTSAEVALFDRCAANVMAVGDSRQMIHADSGGMEAWHRVVPESNRINLKYHYRNAPEICEIADRFAKRSKGHTLISPTCNYRDSPGRVRIHSMELTSQFQTIIDSLNVQLDSYPKEPLGVLFTHAALRDQFWERISESDLGASAICLSDRADWDDSRPIVCSTIHSAKGLEFRAVHLPAFQRNKGREQRNLAYTAVTRAKTSLDIYHEEPFAGWLAEALAEDEADVDDASWDEIFGGKAR